MALAIEITTFTSPTANGTQDITIPGFGTPKAALVLGIHTTTRSEAIDSVFDDVGGMIGWTDGIADRCSTFNSDFGVGTTATARSQVNLLIDQREPPGASKGTAIFTAWITDGIRITWADSPLEHEYVIVLFGGTDITNITSGDHAGNVTLGYRPDLILSICNGATFEATTVNLIQSFGAVWDSSDIQFALNTSSVSAVGTSVTNVYLDSGNGANQLFNDALTWSELYAIQASGFNSSGIGGGDEVGHLAIQFGGDTLVKIGLLETRTSPGTSVISGVGFQPQFVMVAVTNAVANDTVTAGAAASLGVATPTDEYSLSWADEDDQGTTDNQTEIASSVVELPDHDGAVLAKATIDSMDADGFALNYAAADGTARKGFYIAIGQVAPGGVVPTPYYRTLMQGAA